MELFPTPYSLRLSLGCSNSTYNVYNISNSFVVYPKFAQPIHSPNSPLHTEILMNSCVFVIILRKHEREKASCFKMVSKGRCNEKKSPIRKMINLAPRTAQTACMNDNKTRCIA